MNPLNDAKQALLKEGLVSYPDALTALHEFRYEIQERCQDKLRKRLPELARVMGHDVASTQVKPYAWPNNPGNIDLSEGVELGAQWQISGVDQIYLQFYACLGWWSADGITVECYASALLETDNNAFFGTLSEKLNVLGQDDFEIDSSVRQIYICETVLPDNPESCLTTVDAMVLKWIDLWGRVGGLEAILPRHGHG